MRVHGFIETAWETWPGFPLHLSLSDAPTDGAPVEVQVSEVKAIFFVKDFVGNREHRDSQVFSEGKSAGGRKIMVNFKDGETLVGITPGYDPKRSGFFVIPADKDSNNDRCFVIASAVRKVSFI